MAVFGIDIEKKEIYNHCAEAFAGILHDRLHAYLRPNRRGINYEYVYIPSEHQDDDDEDDKGEGDDDLNKPKRKKSYLNIANQKEAKKKIAGDE